MNKEINQIAAGLQKLGVKKGDTVALYMETRREWMQMAHAVWRCGGTVVTVYASLGDQV